MPEIEILKKIDQLNQNYENIIHANGGQTLVSGFTLLNGATINQIL